MLDCVSKNFNFHSNIYVIESICCICLYVCLHITIIEVWTYHRFAFKVKRWWDILLPKFVPLLYDNGGPIIMVQVCCFCRIQCWVCLIGIVTRDFTKKNVKVCSDFRNIESIYYILKVESWRIPMLKL